MKISGHLGHLQCVVYVFEFYSCATLRHQQPAIFGGFTLQDSCESLGMVYGFGTLGDICHHQMLGIFTAQDISMISSLWIFHDRICQSRFQNSEQRVAHPWRLLGVLALKLCNVVHVYYACFMCSTDFSCGFIFTVSIYLYIYIY